MLSLPTIYRPNPTLATNEVALQLKRTRSPFLSGPNTCLKPSDHQMMIEFSFYWHIVTVVSLPL